MAATLGASAGGGPIGLPPTHGASVTGHCQAVGHHPRPRETTGPRSRPTSTTEPRPPAWPSCGTLCPRPTPPHWLITQPADADGSDFDWAVPGDDDAIDNILGTSLDSLVNDGATEDRSPRATETTTTPRRAGAGGCRHDRQRPVEGPRRRPEARASALAPTAPGASRPRSGFSTAVTMRRRRRRHCDPDGQEAESRAMARRW